MGRDAKRQQIIFTKDFARVDRAHSILHISPFRNGNSVVINDFDPLRPLVRPLEANPPLIDYRQTINVNLP